MPEVVPEVVPRLCQACQSSQKVWDVLVAPGEPTQKVRDVLVMPGELTQKVRDVLVAPGEPTQKVHRVPKVPVIRVVEDRNDCHQLPMTTDGIPILTPMPTNINTNR